MNIIDEHTEPQPSLAPHLARNKRIIGISTIAAAIIVILVVVLLVVQPGKSPSSKSTQKTTNAQSVTISFVRATSPIQVPNTVTVATDGSGQIAAKQGSAALAQPLKSAPISLGISGDATVHMQVTNHSSSPIISPQNRTITSIDGQQICELKSSSFQVNPGQTVTSGCAVLPQSKTVYAATYDDTSYPPLEYKGTRLGMPFTVPQDCGYAGQILAQAQSTLQSQLSTTMATDQSIPLGSPQFNLNVTCNPPPLNVQYTYSPTDPLPTYVQQVTGNVTQKVYHLNDVIQYQIQRLQTVAKALPGQYILINPQVCSKVQGSNTATPTKVTLSCPATGTAAWNWDDTTRNTLAASLTGKSEQDALAVLNSTPGIVPGSVQINLPPGASLPADASAISFTVTP